MKENQNVLILIPCCKRKKEHPSCDYSTPLTGIEQLRNQLLEYIKKAFELSKKPENQKGILNLNASLTKAIDLYNGRFYKVAGENLRKIMTGQYPSINVLIVSAFYGLAKLDEGLKLYDLRMDDKLNNMKIYQFWQQNQLWKILQNYIVQNSISYIWSLLSFPYHCVFNDLWSQSEKLKIQVIHVKINIQSNAIIYYRAKWLNWILDTNPNYLTLNPFPPNKIPNIPYQITYDC
ncbi:MAG: peroxide stress protein YaaA [Candidatus Ratteibacteria bacterium]